MGKDQERLTYRSNALEEELGSVFRSSRLDRGTHAVDLWLRDGYEDDLSLRP